MHNYYPPTKKLKFKRRIITKFSTTLLISNYTHLGFKKSFLHQSFRKAALGFHSNISIINPSITLSNLRYVTKFILNLFLKNNKVVYVNYYTPTEFSRTINFGGNYFIFNKWPAGLLSNPYTIITSKILDLPYNFYPYPANAVVILNSDPEKAFLISDEAKTVLIPCFCFADSVFDLDFFPYWIPTNTKSGCSKLFYLLYAESLGRRSSLIKRNYFLRVLRKDKQVYAKEYWLKRKGRYSRTTIRKILQLRRKKGLLNKKNPKLKLKKKTTKPALIKKKKLDPKLFLHPSFRRRTRSKKTPPTIKEKPRLNVKIKKDYKKTWRK